MEPMACALIHSAMQLALEHILKKEHVRPDRLSCTHVCMTNDLRDGHIFKAFLARTVHTPSQYMSNFIHWKV